MSVRLIAGDCRAVLAGLPENSVQMVCTSPPYFGLRSYSTESQVWGGDAACDHDWAHARYYVEGGGCAGGSGEAFSAPGQSNADRIKKARWREDDTCRHCGAWRGELGAEPTVEQYVANIVAVFREVRRILRPDGVLFLVIGDSYAAQGGGKAPGLYEDKRSDGATWEAPRKPPHGLKPKDLIGIPWEVAFALRRDGWWLRSDSIWAKPNPMPESVTDRPTKSHEYIFLFSKRANYYWDQEAVKEAAEFRDYGPEKIKRERNVGGRTDGFTGTKGGYGLGHNGSRNIRSVWTIPTTPFSAKGLGNGYVESDDDEIDHFAAYPPELVERCVKAGSSEKGACPACGSPYRRVVERGDLAGEAVIQQTERPAASVRDVSPSSLLRTNGRTWREKQTVGWQPSCRCENAGDPIPCVILDPFSGSGTTCLVASRLGRDSIGIDLNPDYIEMARKRLVGDAPLFAAVTVVPPA